MNIKKTFLAAIILLVSVLVFAQFASFRFLSTAGILEDHIESILLPVDMVDIEGINIFTNLSNFAFQSENVFSTAVSPNYLVGGKMNFNDIHFGLLHRSNSVNNEIDSTEHYNYFEDISGLGSYDFQYNEILNRNADVKEMDDETYVGLAYGNNESMRFGLSYTKLSSYDSEIFNYTGEYTETNLLTGDLIETGTYFYNEMEEIKRIVNDYGFSFMMPVDNMEFGFTAFVAPSQELYTYDYLDTSYSNYSPSNAGISFYETQDSMEQEIYDINSLAWGLGLIGRMQNDAYETEFGFNYSNTNTPQTEDYNAMYGFEYYYTEPTIIENMEYTQYYLENAIDTLSHLTASQNNISTNVKIVRTLDRAKFGMGLGWSRNTYNRAIIINGDVYYIETWDNGDGITDGGDYTVSVAGDFSKEIISNGLNNNIYLPVGIEFNMNKALVLRLGANTVFSWYNEFYSDKYTEYNPLTGYYLDGDGFEWEWMIDNPLERSDYEYAYNYFYKYTTYSYGIGWDVSENVKVDLMGFANLTNLVNWKVSVNVNFN